MAQPDTTSTSRIPRPSISPRFIPSSNFSNLSLLSESSTGSWERGRVHSNARSPPTHPNLFAEKAAEGSPLRKSHSHVKESSPADGQANLPARLPMRAGPSQHRQQRDGYGFRPASGQTTPTGLGNGSLFSPFVSLPPNGSLEEADNRGDDRDEMDHLPDVRTMDQLRAGVLDELMN